MKTKLTNLSIQKETQESPFVLQQSQTKKKGVAAENMKECKMGLPTEYSPTDPVTSTCQAECSAISRPQESLTIVQKQETGNKDRERLIARA